MANKPFNPGFEQGKGISARRLQLMRDRRLTGIRGGRGILVREMDDGEGGIQALVETRRGPGIGGGRGDEQLNIVQMICDKSDVDTEDTWYKMKLLSPSYPKVPSWLTIDTTNDFIQMTAGTYIYVYHAITEVNVTGTTEGLIDYYIGSSSSDNPPIKGNPMIRMPIDPNVISSVKFSAYTRGFFSTSDTDENTFWHRVEATSVSLGTTPATATGGSITIYKRIS